MSETYTTTHSNARSLTYWSRPAIKPETPWFLVRFVSASPQWELPKHNFYVHWETKKKKNGVNRAIFPLSGINWNRTHTNSNVCLYIYLYMCILVYVCVCIYSYLYVYAQEFELTNFCDYNNKLVAFACLQRINLIGCSLCLFWFSSSLTSYSLWNLKNYIWMQKTCLKNIKAYCLRYDKAGGWTTVVTVKSKCPLDQHNQMKIQGEPGM